MKKIYLMMVAAVMATNVWGAWTEVDSIPAPKCLLDIQYNPKENVISFTDTFHMGETLNRYYSIKVCRPGNFYTNGSTYKHGSLYTIDHVESVAEEVISDDGKFMYKSSGGSVDSKGKFYSSSFESAMDMAYKQGYRNVRLFISCQYQLGSSSQYEDYKSDGKKYVDYVDLELSAVPTCIVSVPETVEYGSDYTVKVRAKVSQFGYYWLQEAESQAPTESDWHTINTGMLNSTAPTAPLHEVSRTLVFDQTGAGPYRSYRVIVSGKQMGIDNSEKDTSEVVQIKMLYPVTISGKSGKDWHSVGETYLLSRAEDCMEYNINSLIPISSIQNHPTYTEFIMPASPVVISKYQPKYKVNFYNADGSLLKETVVPCGEEAPAPDPATFTYHGYEFTEWSRDITNVHKNMNVYARYAIQDGAYTLDLEVADHKNSKYDASYYDFASSDSRAMIGDSITFAATIFAPAEATLRYEYANFKDENGWLWSAPTNNVLGTLSQAEIDAPDAGPKTIRHTQAVAYDYNNELYRSPGFAFRVIMSTMGQQFYSDPIELDVYYPVELRSLIPLHAEITEGLAVQNAYGDLADGSSMMIPARYNDTVYLARQKGTAACVTLKNKKTSAKITTEEDASGRTYFIASEGQPVSIDVDVNRVAVVFDGVSGNGYPKQIDLGTYGKYNGYYGEVVSCGSGVKNMPADPTEDGSIFKGWKSWDVTEYPDNAYLNVPVNVSGQIGFTAEFEPIPEKTYTVRFFQIDPDGTNPKQLGTDQTVKEGESAIEPDQGDFFYIVDGYHFNGWDKSFACVMSDLDIYSLWASNTADWTVTYYDEDGMTVLGTEDVNDGEALVGIIPIKEGYVFDHWVDNTTGDPVDVQHVHGDWHLKAVYKPATQKFVVRYLVGTNVFHSVEVAPNTAVSSTRPANNPTKESTAAEVFTFTGWSPDDVETVTQDLDFTAVFASSPRKYTVRFQNWDHSEIETQQVAYGTAATAPSKKPARAGYTFTGWDMPFDNIKTDLVVTALFKAGVTYYKVTLAAEHGTITCQEENIDLGKVAENTVLHFTATPETGYVFKSWQGYDPASGLTVTEDCTVTAEFEKESQGVDNAPSDQVPSTKLLRDGQIYIIRGEKVYTIDGRKVR